MQTTVKAVDMYLLVPASRGLAKFYLAALVQCGDPEQTVTRPQPQQLTGHTRPRGSVPQLCPQSPEPQWLLCFPDSLSQGKISFGLSQEKTYSF